MEKRNDRGDKNRKKKLAVTQNNEEEWKHFIITVSVFGFK